MGYRRKIDAMHEYFGKDESHTCKTCKNLLKLCYHDKTYYKCKCYGISQSIASDFRQKWTACGLYNETYKGTPLIDVLKHEPRPTEDEQIEGQMGLFDL